MTTMKPLMRAQLAEAALSWIDSHIEQFNPFFRSGEFNDLRQQALGELSLLADHMKRSSVFKSDPRSKKFLEAVRDLTRLSSFRDRLFRIEEEFLPQVIITSVLRRTKTYVDPFDFRIVQRLLDSGNAKIGGVPSHRMLELRWALDLGGFNHNLPSYSSLIEESFLCKRVNFTRFSDLNVYFFTHAIFHASNFGSERIRGMSPERLPELRRTLAILLIMQCNSRHIDLIGELLLSAYCVGRVNPKLYMIGWEILIDSQAGDGSLPGPYFRSEELEKLKESDRAVYLFEKRYHTTLVGALAGVVTSNGR